MLSELALYGLEEYVARSEARKIAQELYFTEDISALIKEIHRLQKRCAICKYCWWDGWNHETICLGLKPLAHGIPEGGLCDIDKFERDAEKDHA
jgi:hypothetical protein